mgnify:CR=1 FL=1
MSLLFLTTLPGIIYLIILRENLGINFNIEKILLFFIFGLISCFFILPIEISIFKAFSIKQDQFFLRSLIFSFVEEMFQFLSLILILKFYNNFKIKNIVIAGVTIGVGFLIIENHLYVYEKTIDLGPDIAFLRSITTSFMHFFNSIIMCGLFSIIYLKKKTILTFSSIVILILVVFNHAIFNYVQYIDLFILIIPILIFQFISSIYVVSMIKKYDANN